MSAITRAAKRKFEGCREIARGRDLHRQRDVRIYYCPGEFDHVGVHDGTDWWIAPVIADPFSVNVPRIMQQLRDGKPVEEIKVERKRKPLLCAEPAPPAEPEPVSRPRPRKALVI
jgi:hypothetical protein